MKKALIPILFGLAAVVPAHAANLQIGSLESCSSEQGFPLSGFGLFSLPGASGTGAVVSSAESGIPSGGLAGEVNVYSYILDLSGIQGENHCVRLAIYFGTPETCGGNQIEVFPDATSVPVLSATEALSSITVHFGSSAWPCLSPGQASAAFKMLSDQPWKEGYVTVVDEYVEPASGLTNKVQIRVAAVVPDIPPISVLPLPPQFQGFIQQQMFHPTNPVPPPPGNYELGMQLYTAASNGLPIGPMITQSVMISNGLVKAPMNFDPGVFFGGRRWLELSVRASGSNDFTTLNPPVPLSPAPQAIYAYTAGSASHVDPSAAVTSVNGLAGMLSIVPGQNISIANSNPAGSDQNGGTITISALIASDRDLKTDVEPADGQDVLARLDALPVVNWRFKKEPEGIRHLGPMAQDFKEAFGLGDDDKTIGIGDEGGVALTAIKALNAQLRKKDAEIKDLRQRLENLERALGETGRERRPRRGFEED